MECTSARRVATTGRAVASPAGEPRQGDDPRKHARLVEWIRANGGRVGSATFRSVDGLGGFYATEPVAAGEEILHIPSELLITPELARRSWIGREIADHADDVSDRAYLAAFVLATRRDGGFWQPYVDTLPTGFAGHPFFFDPAGIRALGTASLARIGVESTRNLCDGDYRKIAAVLARESWSAADFAWAYCCVMTRAFRSLVSGVEVSALVPGVDIMNHTNRPTTRRTTTDDRCAVVAGHAVEAGGELTTSYSRFGNDVLFPIYGFCLEDNPFDRAFIPASPDPFVVPANYGDPAARRMFAALRAAHLADRDAAGLALDRPWSRENERACLASLWLACDRRLGDLGEGEDESPLDGPEPFPGHRDALLARRGERHVLQWYADLAGVAWGALECRDRAIGKNARLAAFAPDYALDLSRAFDGPRAMITTG